MGSPAFQDGVHVIRPIVIPFHGIRLARWINRAITRHVILSKIPTDERQAFYSFSPITYGLEAAFKVHLYHSVDLLHEIEGLPRRALLRAEAAQVVRADATAASSPVVHSHLSSLGGTPEYWPNVADVELFRCRPDEAGRHPTAVFAGHLTKSKVDVAILLAVAEKVPLRLAGPISVDGSRRDEQLSRLLGHSNVEYLGNLGQRDLARLLRMCTVGLIPYELNAYTRGVLPMKVYEYMASGLAVISTALPSLRDTEGVSLGTNVGHFIQLVEQHIEVDGMQISAAESHAEGHSWERRIRQIEATLAAHLEA
ncbi:glycosyltransferase [Modestobacter lapidis]|nr:glycosyltransferase family 1 protein [Modestobacter lapidis]